METIAILMDSVIAERHRRYEEHASTVSRPAEKASEGWRILRTRDGRAIARYAIARLPDGRFAVSTGYEYRGRAGSSSPWSAYPTREQCVAAFSEGALRFFEPVLDGHGWESYRTSKAEMLRLLGVGSLLGFVEPEPTAIEEPYLPGDEPGDEA